MFDENLICGNFVLRKSPKMEKASVICWSLKIMMDRCAREEFFFTIQSHVLKHRRESAVSLFVNYDCERAGPKEFLYNSIIHERRRTSRSFCLLASKGPRDIKWHSAILQKRNLEKSSKTMKKLFLLSGLWRWK